MLKKGDRLTREEDLKSENGKFTGRIDEEGYFTVFYRGYHLWHYSTPLYRVELLNDGNLVFIDQNNLTSIQFDTTDQGDYAVVDNDGSLAVYNTNNEVLTYMGSRLSLRRLF